MKFTATSIKAIKVPAGKADYIVWDSHMPGFGIRFRDGGTGRFMIQYTHSGKDKRIGLGSIAKVTLEEAKIEAQQHFAMIEGYRSAR